MVLLFVIIVTWQGVQVSRDAPFRPEVVKQWPSRESKAHPTMLVFIFRRTQLNSRSKWDWLVYQPDMPRGSSVPLVKCIIKYYFQNYYLFQNFKFKWIKNSLIFGVIRPIWNLLPRKNRSWSIQNLREFSGGQVKEIYEAYDVLLFLPLLKAHFLTLILEIGWNLLLLIS